MKKLFMVDGFFFDKKSDAKLHRDANKESGYKVSLGPDHWRYGLKSNPGTGFPRGKR